MTPPYVLATKTYEYHWNIYYAFAHDLKHNWPFTEDFCLAIYSRVSIHYLRYFVYITNNIILVFGYDNIHIGFKYLI